MTGDGVNDAPALRKANIGFAVEGATAAAQGAASVILLSPGLSAIITAIQRSRKIFQRLQNYLIYRVFMSVFLLTFFFVAIVWVGLDFPTLLIVLMCLILDLATMSLAYDKVIPDPKPNKWNLRRICILAVIIGIVAVAGSLIFLSLMRTNFLGMGTWQQGMKTRCSYGESYKSGKTQCGTENVYFKNVSATDVFPLPNCLPTPWDSKNMYCTAAELNPTPIPLGNLVTMEDWKNVGAKVPPNYNLEDDLWSARTFPYSSAVENMALFLQLCLSCNGALFSARVNDWFFKRRPGVVLTTIMGSEALITSLLAYFYPAFQFWDPNIHNQNYIRLTGLNWRYILFIWVYTIIVFFFMEGTKMIVLKGCVQFFFIVTFC